MASNDVKQSNEPTQSPSPAQTPIAQPQPLGDENKNIKPTIVPDTNTETAKSIQDNLTPDNEIKTDDYEKLKSKLNFDNDSVHIKWESDKDRERPPFMVRMIDDINGDDFGNYNTHLKLQLLNSKNVPQSIPEFKFQRIIPIRKSFFNHLSLTLSIIGCLSIIGMEFIYICIGMNNYRLCGFVDSYLITSGVFHIIIVIVEWIRKWIWNLKNHRDSLPCIHVFQFASTIFLFCMYVFSVTWYTIGFAWIMVPYTESLNKIEKEEIIIVHYASSTNVFSKTFCSASFFHGAIIYQIYVLCIFIFRIVMVGFSQFCRTLCAKISASYESQNGFAGPNFGSNNLNDNLPSIKTFRSLRFPNNTFLPRTLHGTSVCMISDHPEWRQ